MIEGRVYIKINEKYPSGGQTSKEVFQGNTTL